MRARSLPDGSVPSSSTPRAWARPENADVYRRYPHLGAVLPAMGYGPQQLMDLGATIAAVPCDAVLCATPIDLRRLLPIAVPVARRAYELREHLENALAAPVLAASR